MPNRIVSNLQTFGMEIEASAPLSGNFSTKGFQTTNDASIQDLVTYLNSTGFILEKSPGTEKLQRLVPTSSMTSGVELVSQIFDIENMDEARTYMEMAFEKLLEAGEYPFGNPRCGVHFHISMSSPSLRFLKGLVRIWISMEDFIYTLSGMGTVYRGIQNDSCYARPILGPGIYVPFGGGYNWCQLIELEKIFAAENTQDFFYCWGDALNQNRNHYHPVRYYGLNLSACLYKGTVEFRTLNTCLNANWNIAMLNFFQKIMEVAAIFAIKRKEIPIMEQNSIYHPRTKEAMLSSFSDFWGSLAEGDNQTFYTIERILHRTEIPILKEVPIKTHLSRRGNVGAHFQSHPYDPKMVTTNDKISLPNFKDIHIIRGE